MCVVEGVVNNAKELEFDPLRDRQPVKLSEERSCVRSPRHHGDEACSIVLQHLKLPQFLRAGVTQ